MPNSRRKTSSRRSQTRSARSTRSSSSTGRSRDAIALLRADHAEVTEMFQQFEKSRSESKKKDLSSQICIALSVHTRIEEDIFYPAAREALKDKDRELIAEAKVEHAGLKKLISEVENAEMDEMFDARIQVMSEYVKHHVKEEQNEIFPKVRAADLDLKELGQRLQERKQQLMSELSGGADGQGRAQRRLPSSVFGDELEQEGTQQRQGSSQQRSQHLGNRA